MKKEHYVHLLLLGIGAVIVIVYLLRENRTQAVAPAAPSNADATLQQYPNATPTSLGDIEVGGSPINLTYNSMPGGGGLLPSVIIGATDAAKQDNVSDCCDSGGGCAGSGSSPLQLVQTVPASAIKNAAENLQGFKVKLGTALNFSSQVPEFLN